MLHGSQPHTPSSDRPLPLAMRADLVLRESKLRGESVWVAKDPVTLEYFHLTPQQHTLLRLLDARRSLTELREEYLRLCPASRPSLSEVQRLAFDLFDKGLAYSTRADQGAALADRAQESRRRRIKAALQNPLYVQFPGFDPTPLMRFASPVARVLFCRAAVIAGLLLVLATWLMLWTNRHDYIARLPELDHFSSWQGIVVLWVTIGAAKLLHEFGHALACRRLGGECHEIGVALLVLSPCLYCDVSDAAMLPSRVRRMLVGAAGIYVELVLSAAAALLWVNLSAGLLADVCLSLFLVTNVSTILFNLNPLLRYDGYYLLCDLTDTPNLRERANHAVNRVLARHVLGVELPRQKSDADQPQPLLFLYGVASGAYRWFFLATISLVVYRTLAPYGLGALGWLLGLTAVVLSLATSGRQFWRFLQSRRDDLRETARPRLAVGIGAAACAAFLFAPLPLRVSTRCYLQPAGASHVYITAAGRLERVLVAPGDHVRAGQPLAVLSDYAALDQYHAVCTEVAKNRIDLVVYQTTGDAAAEAVARETYNAAYQRGLDQHQQLESLWIDAPCEGVVIGPAEKHARTDGAKRGDLPSWTGSPLDPHNIGAHLEAGAHLLSIASQECFDAVLLIDQTTRSEFREGGTVRVKLDSRPCEVLVGTIEEITQQAAHDQGGLVSPDAAGPSLPRLSREPAMFQARVKLAGDAPVAIAGVEGVAKTWVTHRTPAEWLWRQLRLTFSLTP